MVALKYVGKLCNLIFCSRAGFKVVWILNRFQYIEKPDAWQKSNISKDVQSKDFIPMISFWPGMHRVARAALGCPGLPIVARVSQGCQSCPELPRVARLPGSPRLASVNQGCHGCPGLPRVALGFQDYAGCQGCTELPGLPRFSRIARATQGCQDCQCCPGFLGLRRLPGLHRIAGVA